jgi:hypothetical protein
MDRQTTASGDGDQNLAQEIINRELPGWIIVPRPDLPQPPPPDPQTPSFEELRSHYAAWRTEQPEGQSPEETSTGTPAAAPAGEAQDIAVFFVRPAKIDGFLPRAAVLSLTDKTLIGLEA